MKKVFFIVAAILLVLIPCSNAYAEFGVSPAKITIDGLYPGASKEVTIRVNNFAETGGYAVKVRVPDILSDDNRAVTGEEVNWFQYPEYLSISTGSANTLKVLINIPKNVVTPERIEAWLGVTEDIAGMRWELVSKIVLHIGEKVDVSGKGIVVTEYGTIHSPVKDGVHSIKRTFNWYYLLIAGAVIALVMVIAFVFIRKRKKLGGIK